jgi:hypothetical protein
MIYQKAVLHALPAAVNSFQSDEYAAAFQGFASDLFGILRAGAPRLVAAAPGPQGILALPVLQRQAQVVAERW